MGKCDLISAPLQSKLHRQGFPGFPLFRLELALACALLPTVYLLHIKATLLAAELALDLAFSLPVRSFCILVFFDYIVDDKHETLSGGLQNAQHRYA